MSFDYCVPPSDCRDFADTLTAIREHFTLPQSTVCIAKKLYEKSFCSMPYLLHDKMYYYLTESVKLYFWLNYIFSYLFLLFMSQRASQWFWTPWQTSRGGRIGLSHSFGISVKFWRLNLQCAAIFERHQDFLLKIRFVKNVGLWRQQNSSVSNRTNSTKLSQRSILYLPWY